MAAQFAVLLALCLLSSVACDEKDADKFSLLSCSLQGAQSQTFFLSDGLYPIPSQTLDASLFAIGKVSLQGSFIKSHSLEMHVAGSASLNDWNSTIAAVVNTTGSPIHTSGFKSHAVFNQYLRMLLESSSKNVLLRSRVLVLLPVSSSLERDEWTPMPPSLFHREYRQRLSPLLVSLSPLGETSKQPKLMHTMQRLHAISRGPKLSSSVAILLYLHRFSVSAVPAPRKVAPGKLIKVSQNKSEKSRDLFHEIKFENSTFDRFVNFSRGLVNASVDEFNMNSSDAISVLQIIGNVKTAELGLETSISFRSILVSLFFWLKDFYANILWLVSHVAWPLSRIFRFIVSALVSFVSSIMSFINMSSSPVDSNWVDVDSVPDSAHVSSTDFGHRSHLSINASFVADELPSDLDQSTIDSSLRSDVTNFLVRNLSYEEFIERWPGATFNVTLTTDRHNSLPCGAVSIMRQQLVDLLKKDVKELLPLLNSNPNSPDPSSESCLLPSLSPLHETHTAEICPNAEADLWPLFPSIINCTAMEQKTCTDAESSNVALQAIGGIEAVGLVVRIWRRSLLSCAESAVHAVPYALRASSLQELPRSDKSNSEDDIQFALKTLNFTRSDCLWSYPYSASRGAFLFELFASIGILLTTVAILCLIFVAGAFVGALMDAGILRVPTWLSIADVAVTFRIPLFREVLRAGNDAQ